MRRTAVRPHRYRQIINLNSDRISNFLLAEFLNDRVNVPNVATNLCCDLLRGSARQFFRNNFLNVKFRNVLSARRVGEVLSNNLPSTLVRNSKNPPGSSQR
jgi:hypothetical protein